MVFPREFYVDSASMCRRVQGRIDAASVCLSTLLSTGISLQINTAGARGLLPELTRRNADDPLPALGYGSLIELPLQPR